MTRKEMLDTLCEISDKICNNAVDVATRKEMNRAIDSGFITQEQANKFMAYIHGASSMVIRDSYEEYSNLELEKMVSWLTDPLYVKMVSDMTSRSPRQLQAYKANLCMFARSETDYVVREMLLQGQKGI